MKFEFAKRNKRMMIIDDKGECVYTPPDFLLPLASRTLMIDLAEAMSVAEDPFLEIVAFESNNRKAKR